MLNPAESFVITKPCVDDKLFNDVLIGISKNVKMGPFTASSGVSLPCKCLFLRSWQTSFKDFLNLATNFMDKQISPKILQVVGQTLTFLFNDQIKTGDIKVICGMEAAGGMLVSQLCSAGTLPFMKDISNLDCILL